MEFRRLSEKETVWVSEVGEGRGGAIPFQIHGCRGVFQTRTMENEPFLIKAIVLPPEVKYPNPSQITKVRCLIPNGYMRDRQRDDKSLRIICLWAVALSDTLDKMSTG